MTDLIAGLGIAIVIEGMLWALAPDLARRMVREMAELEGQQLQVAAWGLVAIGLFLVWLTRG
jgi:uncharacterized protein